MVQGQDTKFEQSMVKLSVWKSDSRDYRVQGSDPLLNVPCPHHFFVNGGREPGNEVLDIWPLEHTTLMSKRTQTTYQQIRTNPHTTQGYALAWLIGS